MSDKYLAEKGSPTFPRCGKSAVSLVFNGQFLTMSGKSNLEADQFLQARIGGWGFHRLTIHVYPGTETYDRGGFFLHGGTHPGSAGCINLHAGMEQFVVALEAATKEAPDCYIPLTVRY